MKIRKLRTNKFYNIEQRGGIHKNSYDIVKIIIWICITNKKNTFKSSEAEFLVMCNPSMNKLWANKTGLCIDLYESRLLTACS